MENCESKENFELLNLKKVFNEGKRAFVVPEYQRGYSWEKRQREDLLRDIENLFESDYTHYTGTIVASSKNECEGNVEYFDIVDGQQRLTSLVILLATIWHENNLKKEYVDELQNIFIASGIDTGNTVRKFSLNTLLDYYFYKYIKQEKPESEAILTKSHRNISDAFLQFTQWLKSVNITNDSLYEIITKRLGFLLYAPKNSTEIGIMFEVINNRGKPLSELEKIKNYLMYFSEKNNINDLRIAINENWSSILANLNESGITSNDDENAFLRNCWIVFADTNKSKSHHVYDSLKELCPAEEKDKWRILKELVLFITNASKTYRYLLSTNNISEISNGERTWLKYISLHASNASILPLVIAIYERVTEEDKRVVLLEYLEKLNFRYYGCGIANRADTGQGGLFLWAHTFYNNYNEDFELEGKIYSINENWLHIQLQNFIEKHANDNLFVEYLTLDKDEDYDYYNWNNLRFFLASYEETLRNKKGRSTDLMKMLSPQKKEAKNDYYHKEHIWACKEFTVIKEEEDINKRRLGNFVLLEPSINCSVSNDRVEKKIDDYFNATKVDIPNTYMLYELKKFYKKAKQDIKGEWQRKTYKYWYALYQDFLDTREEKLINFALDRWRVDNINKSINRVSIVSRTDNNKIYRSI